MKFQKIVFVLVFFNMQMFSQKIFDKTIYVDSLGYETIKEKCKIYRVIEEYYKEKSIYNVKEYYASGKILKEGKTSAKDFLREEGEFIYYYENGNKQSVQNYINGNNVGKIFFWYENGNKKLEGEYFEVNEQSSFSKLAIYQYWNSNNVQKVINGNGEYFNDDENTFSSGFVKNGDKDGMWKGRDKKLKLTFNDNYENGIFISGTSIDSLKNEHTYKKIHTSPVPKKGINHFYKFIKKKYNVSKRIFKNELLIIEFNVDLDGKLCDFEILQGINPESDNEAIRVVKEYDNWIPGEYRGIKMKFAYKIPIKVQPAK